MTQYSYNDLIKRCTDTEASLVTLEKEGHYAVVTMNDPKRLNCLSGPLTVQLLDKLSQAAADTDVRTIILTGADPAFSAGGDMELMQMAHDSIGHQSPEGVTIMRNWIRYQFGGVARLIKQTEKLVISAINGAAAGVGLSFAFASDILIGSEKARIVPAFGKIGLTPEVGTSWYLTRKLGYNKAIEYYLKGQELSAEEALSHGILNQVVAHEELLDAAIAYAEQVHHLPASVFGMAKTLLRRAGEVPWDQAIELEEFIEPICFTTEFHQKAVSRFLGR
ncbi:enoyl-CoA hydratase [Hahella sp. CCB-MM4]|uniref:enoyl-CoA hydratase/isomerase family protein n=1 Tax=Hahella sp. (strain CCB-MM4) TaxID=1926491 RepID=UPI000B9B9BD0|nr:enoyl-CoA hydratase/isomerase family protein [Hahella sp. CCB-MM4]OZG71345.1 enoyl-CoA hydratase [Hahella sp. CCB-MM4]